MFALKMFYKYLIATGFPTHHFKTFLKCFLSNVLKMFITNAFRIFRMLIKCKYGNYRILSKMAHRQYLEVLKWGPIFIPEQPKNIMNLTPIGVNIDKQCQNNIVGVSNNCH